MMSIISSDKYLTLLLRFEFLHVNSHLIQKSQVDWTPYEDAIRKAADPILTNAFRTQENSFATTSMMMMMMMKTKIF